MPGSPRSRLIRLRPLRTACHTPSRSSPTDATRPMPEMTTLSCRERERDTCTSDWHPCEPPAARDLFRRQPPRILAPAAGRRTVADFVYQPNCNVTPVRPSFLIARCAAQLLAVMASAYRATGSFEESPRFFPGGCLQSFE